MVREIRKNSWSKFCKEFNQTNQYRSANITIIDKNNNESELTGNMPFLGIGLQKKGRLIDGVEFFAGRWDPEKLTQPALSIKEPDRIMLEKDPTGADNCLWVDAKDGSRARIELQGEKNPEMYWTLVEKVAYSIFERRGYSTGNDMNDWLEAERLVKQTEAQLTE